MGRKKKHNKEEEKEIEEDDGHQLSFGVGSEAKRSVAAVFLFALAVVILLGFFGKAGVVGTKLSDFIGLTVGRVKWLFPLFLILGGVILIIRGKTSFYVYKLMGLLVILLGITGLFHWFSDLEKMKEIASAGHGGGYIGFVIAYLSVKFLGVAGSFVVILALILVGIIVSFELTLHRIIDLFRTKDDGISDEDEEDEEIEEKSEEEPEKEPELENEKLPLEKEEKELAKEDGGKNIGKIQFVEGADQYVDDDLLEKNSGIETKSRTSRGKVNEVSCDPEWELPPTKLLEKSVGGAKGGNTDKNEEIIEKTFHNFRIEVARAGHQVGPAVTQYRFRPEVGVKVAQILGLHNDIALSLAKHPIRIEAPIPGQSLIGIEVPNDTPATVRLRDLVESDDFKNRESNLTLALGEDVSGTHIFTDLGKMPHLMIAGSTGTGKSVSINSIITTLLYQNSPNDLKFIMVDPKRVELSMYSGIPHLLTPVITDNAKVVGALKWVVGEMERRYRLLQDIGSQNIASYQEKFDKGGIRKYTNPETGEVSEEKLEKLPYIVVVIDELAELMMSHGKDVEGAIVRIAQLARAVGIHLIISTQRPEVKIITGLIKANINARIAFKVNTNIDSRTVLDMGGAEKLLGNGDLLYISSVAPKPKRIQGVYIDEKEVKKVVKFIKSQKVEVELGENIGGETEGDEGIPNVAKSLEVSLEKDLTGGGNQDDELYEAAKEEVKRAGKASASLLQRRLRVGYARAARILDLLENDGIVGPSDGAKPREVYGNDDPVQYESPIEDQTERDKWQS